MMLWLCHATVMLFLFSNIAIFCIGMVSLSTGPEHPWFASARCSWRDKSRESPCVVIMYILQELWYHLYFNGQPMSVAISHLRYVLWKKWNCSLQSRQLAIWTCSEVLVAMKVIATSPIFSKGRYKKRRCNSTFLKDVVNVRIVHSIFVFA